MNILEINPPLHFTDGTENIWQALQAIPRTGWVQWGIPNPETVAEHILSIRELAERWKDKIELDESGYGDLLAIIEVHDWPEVVVGDLVIMGDEHNVIELRNSKRDKEKSAMIELCRILPDGDVALKFYQRYELNSDLPAQYAKQLDKLQDALLAKDYEEQYKKPGLLKEFILYSENYIDIPFLKNELDKLKVYI